MKQGIKAFLAGGLLALALFGAATAGPLDDARTAAERGDYTTELQILRPLAEQGNVFAQYNLAWMYAQGQGMPEDSEQAVAWYRKAADQGYLDAEANLGMAYAQGQGVPQDYVQAFAWCHLAAGQGNADAQTCLGMAYAEGQGVSQNYAEAAAWFRKAADQGNALAQYHLGLMYARREGVAEDHAQAAVWWRKAAEQGNVEAQAALGVMYELGQGVAQDHAQAVTWVRKAADQGYAPAQGFLGEMYRDGLGVPQDYVRAQMWLNLAASRSDNATRQMAVKARDDVAAKMTPAQIAEAQRMASEWMRAHGPPVTAPPIGGMGESPVPMISDGGTYKVPVTINAQLTLKFVVDSGAADVSVPADVVLTLLRTETITDADFLDKQTYQLADGSTVPSQRFVIRTLKIGDKTVENVVGSIAPAAGSLLLGQSFLGRFKAWSIDNKRRALIFIDDPLEQPTVSSPRPSEISGSSSPSRPLISTAGEPHGGPGEQATAPRSDELGASAPSSTVPPPAGPKARPTQIDPAPGGLY